LIIKQIKSAIISVIRVIRVQKTFKTGSTFFLQMPVCHFERSEKPPKGGIFCDKTFFTLHIINYLWFIRWKF